MIETILAGRGREIVRIPRAHWEAHLAEVPERMRPRLAWMSKEHHAVRYFVVEELPRLGRPISPQLVSERLRIPVDVVNKILEDLEKHLFFLVRNVSAEVTWAFPVTVEETPHHLVFSSGEKLNGA
jgi:hypothetical protein